MNRRLLSSLLLVSIAVAWGLWQGTPSSTPGTTAPPATSSAERSPDAAPGGTGTAGPEAAPEAEQDGRVLPDVVVLSYGRPVYRGDVDLRPTFDRIARGERHPHRRDGSTFFNREGRLPKRPRGYYREYVHPTPGIRGAGPQRLVLGRDGDAWYTPDHYATFVRVAEEAPMTSPCILHIPASISGKDALLAHYARSLEFPDWWGRNWDALWDLLANPDVTPGPLRIEHEPGFALPPHDGEVYETLLADLAEERRAEVEIILPRA